MKQARTVISTYSADAFGVCSALYELGGMVVMHDASGCNSTYSTHDEPRWYGSRSLIFISALTEIEAIMGDDEKVIGDMVDTIGRLHPRFAAIAGTPIPMMTGCDLRAIAAEVEARSGIPCFAFGTNGMRSYLCGASEALAAIADRMTDRSATKRKNAVNILGATPLDFSLSGTVPSIAAILRENGFDPISTWAMGSSLEDLRRAGEAEVNLVISGAGMKAARLLQARFGTPIVVGTPVGTALTGRILDALRSSAADGRDRIVFDSFAPAADCEAYILGEPVTSRSLAAALHLECGADFRTVSTLEALPELSGVLGVQDVHASEEEALQQMLSSARLVIADPMYRPILPAGCGFLPLPHEAFSGRIWRKRIPDLTKLDLPAFLKAGC